MNRRRIPRVTVSYKIARGKPFIQARNGYWHAYIHPADMGTPLAFQAAIFCLDHKP